MSHIAQEAIQPRGPSSMRLARWGREVVEHDALVREGLEARELAGADHGVDRRCALAAAGLPGRARPDRLTATVGSARSAA